MAGKTKIPADGAEAVLLSLKENGVDYLFANAGTDFPPIIEAYAKRSAAGIAAADYCAA